MKSRHRAREIALQILYQYDLNSQSQPTQPAKPLPFGQALLNDLTRHYEHFNVPETLREFVGQLVSGTLNDLKSLDEILEKHTSNWKISRMSAVDRSLLRMATYEMMFVKAVPPSVVIDEAIELAKDFGTAETPAFINGILDSIKNLSKEAPEAPQ